MSKPRQLRESWSRWQRLAALSSQPLPCFLVPHDREFAPQACPPSSGPSCKHKMLRIVTTKSDTFFNCGWVGVENRSKNMLAKMSRNADVGCILPNQDRGIERTVTRYPNPHKYSA